MKSNSSFLPLVLAGLLLNPFSSIAQHGGPPQPSGANAIPTTTPIKHLVVIFDENISFDLSSGTYPNATGSRREPQLSRL